MVGKVDKWPTPRREVNSPIEKKTKNTKNGRYGTGFFDIMHRNFNIYISTCFIENNSFYLHFSQKVLSPRLRFLVMIFILPYVFPSGSDFFSGILKVGGKNGHFP